MWGDLYASLPGKTPKEVTETAAKMQVLRDEMEITPNNSCSGAAREVMLEGMGQVHAVRRGSRELQSCAQAAGHI